MANELIEPKKDATALAVRVQTVSTWLRAQEPEFARVLGKGMDPQYFSRVVFTACRFNPRLLEAASTPGRAQASFALAVMHSAALGLEPSTPLGLCYLVPLKGLVELWIGYKGYVQLAWRSPRPIALTAKVVREKDDYEYEERLPLPKFHHRPLPASEGGELVAAYAIARGAGIPATIAWLWREDVEKRRASSAGYQAFLRGETKETPWVTHEESMWRKTAVKAIAPFLPMSPLFQRALSVDEQPQEPELEAPEKVNPLDAMAEALRQEHLVDPEADNADLG